MRNEVIRALAAALIAAVLLAVGFNRAWPLNLDIGTNDDRFVSGFLEIEQFGDTGVRWTDGDATIAIPRPACVPPIAVSRCHLFGQRATFRAASPASPRISKSGVKASLAA